MKKFLSLYFRTVKLAMKHWPVYLMGLLFTLFWVVILNYAVFKIKDIINAIESGSDLLRPLFEMGLVLVAPLFIQPIALYFKSKAYSYVTGEILNTVYKRVMSLDYKYHTNKETGRVVSMIMNSQEIPMMFLWEFEIFAFEQLAAIVIPLIILSTISPEIALYSAITIIVLIPIYVILIKHGVNERGKLKEVEYKRNSAIIDGVTNYETVRIFARKQQEVHYLTKLVDANMVAIDKYQMSFRILDFASHLGGIIIFGIGGYFIYSQRNVLSVGEIVVIITYLLQLAGKILHLVFGGRHILKNLPVVEDIFELMDRRSTIKEPKVPRTIAQPKGEIEFDNVEFSYNKGIGVLDGISFKIKPGETVAFVGPSGGGKSTIARMILRYFDVKKGKVKIDGVNVKSLGTDNVNELIGVVPQEPVLFNRSLKYNIGYGFSANEEDLDRYMDKIIEAAKEAQIYDFIQTLPEGFETNVGERGLKLSGGQKQRVAIARVLIKNPKIVIFDEATSMLDSESEGAIQEAFKELSKNSTTIIIAHRLSTIKNVDRIFVIDKGTVIEEGSHAKLLKGNGTYSRLWKIQSEGFKKED